MIIGIGNDMIEVERVRKACRKAAFLTRYFTSEEINAFGKKPVSLAGNFCVKESVAKAFGTGFREITPIDIEVLRDELGKPYVNLYGKAQELADRLEIKKIHVSISNLKELAEAFVVIEG
jgi:holo-[acyl-carrier protein] synthase